MQRLRAMSRNPVLSFGIVVALCVTLVIWHQSPNHGREACTSPKNNESVPTKKDTEKQSPPQSIKQETLRSSAVKEEELPPLNLDQENKALVDHIRRLVVPPSELPYNLSNPGTEHFSQFGQTQFLMKRIFPNKRYGFFLEVGAADGELYSNTLFLERRMGWRGLLIEANPSVYKELLLKHRKAYSVQAALSLTNKSTELKFRVAGRKGVLSSVWNKEGKTITVPAFPLYAVLKALDVPVIDYFSLDVEGIELQVLDTVPWDRVKVRVMQVECNHLRGRTKKLVPAMEARGMHFIGTRKIDAWFVCPELYKHVIQKV